MLSDTVISLIRTWVPVVIGAVLTFLATKLGIVVDEDSKTNAILAATAVVTSAYYAVVRLLEKKFPWAGLLLGSRRAPAYTPPAA